MKRLSTTLALAIVATLMLFSCMGKTGQSADNSDTLFTAQLRIDSICCDTLYVYGSESDAPTCRVSIRFPFASGDFAAAFNDSVAGFLPNIEAKRPLTLDYITEKVRHGASDFVASFVNDMANIADDNPDYMRGAGYSLDVKYSLTRPNDSVLVCCMKQSAYTGGAHGLYSEDFYNIDLSDGHIISLSDICDKSQTSALIDAIVKQLEVVYKCTSLKQLQDKHNIFMLSDEPVMAANFYYAADGITFVYNEYEIAPYSEGIIKVTVPYATMKQFAPVAH